MSGRSDNLEREAGLLSWIRQHAPYGVVTLDESFQVQSWNHWMELHSGKRFEDVAGKDLFTLYPDIQERRLAGHFERALQGESSVLSTALHHYLLPLPSPFRQTGVPMMLQTARISPLFYGGKVCGIVLVIEDVTQRESQAEALGRQHRRDELLSWALAHLLRTEQPRKAVRQLFFKIAEQLDFDTFLIYLRDLETGKVTLEAVGGVPVESENDFFDCPFPDLLAGESAEPVVLKCVQALPEPQYAALKRARISVVIGIPLRANDRNLGLLCFAAWTRDSIADDETELVNTIAQYLATALDRENTHSQLLKAKQLLSEHADLLEKRVQERTARLQETIDELEHFSYTITHDMRAPLRSMQGFGAMALSECEERLSPELADYLRRITGAACRMDALIRDSLQYAKAVRENIPLVPVEPLRVLRGILESYPNLQSPRVEIQIVEPLPAVIANEAGLGQCFSNLLINAVKFVRPGKVPHVCICAEARGNHVRFWFEDNGIGIPAKYQERIFHMFQQLDRSYEGTGIGLALVRKTAQRMGGKVGVESELGKGSRFWLEFEKSDPPIR